MEKSKEETSKYSTLKNEEQRRVNEVDELNTNLNAEYKELEEIIKKMNNELKLMQKAHSVQVEYLEKEIAMLNEGTRSMKKQGNITKVTGERMKAEFEADYAKVHADMLYSEKKVYHTIYLVRLGCCLRTL